MTRAAVEAAKAAAGFAQRPGIACSWCGLPVKPGGRRMRLLHSEGIRVSGQWLAHFHVECGEAILDVCERHVADVAREAASLPAPPAPDPAPAPVVASREAKPTPVASKSAKPSKPAAERKARAVVRVEPPKVVKVPAVSPPRLGPPSPAPRAKAQPLPASDLVAAVRDLAGRGFLPNMIAARLRAPYAEVRAALAAPASGSQTCVSRGDGA